MDRRRLKGFSKNEKLFILTPLKLNKTRFDNSVSKKDKLPELNH